VRVKIILIKAVVTHNSAVPGCRSHGSSVGSWSISTNATEFPV